MKVAIFGGTFDPVHSGHLTIAREAARQFALDRVLFVPASRPPHKSGATAAGYEDRYRMVEIACQDQPGFEPSRLEAGAARSYSIHTIERVRATLTLEDDLSFLIGADAFADLRTWRQWQDVVRQVTFIVVARPASRYEVPPGASIARLDSLALPVSSSAIRAQLATNLTPAEIPPPVLAYIRQKGLYGVGAYAGG